MGVGCHQYKTQVGLEGENVPEDIEKEIRVHLPVVNLVNYDVCHLEGESLIARKVEVGEGC